MMAILAIWWWSLRRSRSGILALLVGIAMFEFIQPVAIKSFGELDRLTAILPFVPPQFFALMNVTPDYLSGSGLPGFLTLGFSHPVYHLLTAATVIWVAGRSLAGEMERGSIQVALSRPVSRLAVYLAAALNVLTVALLIAVAAPAGMALGLVFADPDGVMSYQHFVAQGVASFLLLAGIGGIALMISACSDRLGQALGIAIALFVVSYVIDYFASLWDALQPLLPFSLFNYYDPARALTAGSVEPRNVGVLLALGGIAAAAGFAVFQRRDLPNE